MASETSSIGIRFQTRPSPQKYPSAVLTCQFALTLVGLGHSTTAWPGGTATDVQINELSDRWLATGPWVGLSANYTRAGLRVGAATLMLP